MNGNELINRCEPLHVFCFCFLCRVFWSGESLGGSQQTRRYTSTFWSWHSVAEGKPHRRLTATEMEWGGGGVGVAVVGVSSEKWTGSHIKDKAESRLRRGLPLGCEKLHFIRGPFPVCLQSYPWSWRWNNEARLQMSKCRPPPPQWHKATHTPHILKTHFTLITSNWVIAPSVSLMVFGWYCSLRLGYVHVSAKMNVWTIYFLISTLIGQWSKPNTKPNKRVSKKLLFVGVQTSQTLDSCEINSPLWQMKLQRQTF